MLQKKEGIFNVQTRLHWKIIFLENAYVENEEDSQSDKFYDSEIDNDNRSSTASSINS